MAFLPHYSEYISDRQKKPVVNHCYQRYFLLEYKYRLSSKNDVNYRIYLNLSRNVFIT